MKKFKLVKTAAALALGASVVTSAVVPGATDASAASKYKVSNGKLLNAKTGKAVKGYVVYKSKLYYNGKLKQGYKTAGTGKSIKLYFNGSLKKGYKTARDNKLLFFNGKLKKGYKTALNGEFLYKNGLLNKGYKVYGAVAKNPVLYYNGTLKSGYKTANNGSLLFYNGKLKSGLKTYANDTVLYKNGRLAKGLVEANGKFYKDGKLANGEVDGTFYKDGKAVVALEGVKAINNTTVEVTFKDAQVSENIKASRFAIEGLEVKNAAVQQTNSKVVVLTTSAQEAGKTYTLSVDGVKAKTFTAVSSVAPTAVELSTPSLQGVLGKEVSVTSKVTVPAGQSKAGIPVTFNIGASGLFNESKKIEAFTDENGVAKISYTQYHPGEDTVYAYPTGSANVKTTVGKVYWGNTERLTVIDVTAGATFANGGKKVYKISSPENANKSVNVTFKENVGVTPDKLVRDIKVVDASKVGNENQLLSGDITPWQVTTGGYNYAQVKLDASGNATFTVSGSNGTVTPIVFADGSNDDYKTAALNNKLEATELQAQASSVTFDKSFTQALKVVAAGTANAAATNANGTGEGGRNYTVTVTDKDGKLATKGTRVYVTFKKGDVPSSNNVKINGTTIGNYGDGILIKVGDNGEATFRVTGSLNDYATPTVFIDNGADNAKLDTDDLQLVGETTYFLKATVTDAKLTVNDADKEVKAGTIATFTYQSLDQNGFPYALSYDSGTGNYYATFTVNAKFGDVTVSGNGVTPAVVGQDYSVKQGTNKSFKVLATSGVAKLNVNSIEKAEVTVDATASQVSLPSKNVTINFVTDANTVISADVLANIKAATKKEQIGTALEKVANYNDLSVAAQNYVVDSIFAELGNKDNITSISVAKLIDEAESKAAAQAALAAAQAEVAKIDATTPTQAQIDAAQAKVDLVAAGTDKDALQAQIDAAKAKIVAAQAKVATATTAVNAIDATTPTQTQIDAAQAKVDLVAAGTDKDALQAKIDAAQVTVNKIAGLALKAVTDDYVAAYGTSYKVNSLPVTQKGENIKVTGTANYVTDFTGFNSSDVSEQEGNYIPVTLTAPTGINVAPGATIQFSTDGGVNWKTGTADAANKTFFVKRVNGDTAVTLDFDWDNDSSADARYVIDYSGVTLTPAP